MIDWIIAHWFWIALWWAVWFALFISWYERQVIDGHKQKTSALEAFIMFLISGFGPILAILIFIGKALALNDRDSDK